MEINEKLDSVATNMPTSSLRATAHQAVDKFAQAATESVHSLDLKRKQMAETGHELVIGSRKFVQERPATSIGIALLAGFLLRHLLRFR